MIVQAVQQALQGATGTGKAEEMEIAHQRKNVIVHGVWCHMKTAMFH